MALHHFRPIAMSYASIIDEHVEQAGDDQKGVAVLVGDGAHLARAVTERAGGEVESADAEIGERGERDERLRQIERKEAALNARPIANMSGSATRKISPFAAPQPQVPAPGDGPRGEASSTSVPGSADALARSAAVDFVTISTTAS